MVIGHLRARLAAQLFHRLPPSGSFLRALAVDFDDAVAGQDAGAESRRVFHRRDDGDVIVRIETTSPSPPNCPSVSF